MQSSFGNSGGVHSPCEQILTTSSFRMRNNSYSNASFYSNTNPTATIWSNSSSILPVQSNITTNFPLFSSSSIVNHLTPTSIQQFLNSDMLASMSRSNSQPDLTATIINVPSSVTQLTTSKSMSVCSDDLNMDITGCQSNFTDDFLLGFEASFNETSDFSDIFENECFPEFDETQSLFPALANTSSLSETPPPPPQRSAPPSPKPQPKDRNSLTRRSLPTKLWSKMSNDEQTCATEDLTSIINEQLGRREQLEIIRILQPDGPQLLPHQTEFALDFSKMNDDKHRRIRNIIKFNLLGGGSVHDDSDGYSSLSSNKSDPLHQRMEKFFRLRQRKEQRQAAKEHRSGLFNAQHHQVLKLTKCDEDIEVDILS